MYIYFTPTFWSCTLQTQKHANTYAKGLDSLSLKAEYYGYFSGQNVEGETVESLEVFTRNYHKNWGFSKVRLGKFFVNPEIEILDCGL